jgi:hypothetical protein
MFLTAQGRDPHKRIDELEKRVEYLENIIKGLQSPQIPKRGRPPKDAYGQPETQKPD